MRIKTKQVAICNFLNHPHFRKRLLGGNFSSKGREMAVPATRGEIKRRAQAEGSLLNVCFAAAAAAGLHLQVPPNHQEMPIWCFFEDIFHKVTEIETGF
jgi:hypothetical protein